MKAVVAALIVVFCIVLLEFSAYVWHRFGSHPNPIFGPEFTAAKNRTVCEYANRPHRMHHEGHDRFANSDFAVVLIPVLLFMSAATAGYFALRVAHVPVCREYLYLVIAVALAHLVASYLMHMSYHLDTHPLDNFAWYRRCRRLHGLHHTHPKSNFGICSFFCDSMFGTLRESADAETM